MLLESFFDTNASSFQQIDFIIYSKILTNNNKTTHTHKKKGGGDHLVQWLTGYFFFLLSKYPRLSCFAQKSVTDKMHQLWRKVLVFVCHSELSDKNENKI